MMMMMIMIMMTLCRHAISLYAHITNIRWDFDNEKLVKGRLYLCVCPCPTELRVIGMTIVGVFGALAMWSVLNALFDAAFVFCFSHFSCLCLPLHLAYNRQILLRAVTRARLLCPSQWIPRIAPSSIWPTSCGTCWSSLAAVNRARCVRVCASYQPSVKPET
jgi:hypothetical protein